MFDSVYAPCPNCGHSCEFQTKEGECYLNVYSLEDAPTELLIDIMNDPHWCPGCKQFFALIDPAFPPGPPPRPDLRGAMVREPTEGEFHVYSHNPDHLRWWDAPFTFDDLVSPSTPEPTS